MQRTTRRERERERQRHLETDTETETETQSVCVFGGGGGSERLSQNRFSKDVVKFWQMMVQCVTDNKAGKRHRHRDTETQRHRDTETETDRQRQTQTQRDRDRGTESETVCGGGFLRVRFPMNGRGRLYSWLLPSGDDTMCNGQQIAHRAQAARHFHQTRVPQRESSLLTTYWSEST